MVAPGKLVSTAVCSGNSPTLKAIGWSRASHVGDTETLDFAAGRINPTLVTVCISQHERPNHCVRRRSVSSSTLHQHSSTVPIRCHEPLAQVILGLGKYSV